MYRRFIDLTLFDDGNEGGSGAGAQGTGAGTNGNAGQNGGTGYSFEQAEEIANARAQRAEKAALAGYFKQQGLSEDEVTKAINEYKAQQAAAKPDTSKIAKERDEALAELAALKNSNLLRKSGVREDDLDYVLFKVNALMKEDDKLTFEKAAAKYLKDNPRYTSAGGGYRVSAGTDGSHQGSSSGRGENASINDAIRRRAGH